MKQKSLPWIAWFFAGFVILASLYGIVRQVMTWEVSLGPVVLAGHIVWLIFPAVFAVTAALIVSRQPRNLIGWLLMFPALTMNLTSPNGLPIYASSPPASPSFFFILAIWFDNWSWILLMFPILLILLLFPTGRPPSPRWRWVLVYAAIKVLIIISLITFAERLTPLNGEETWWVANPIGFINNDFLSSASFSVPWTISLILFTIICVSAVFVRFRRGTALERAQIKWFLFACAIFTVVYSAIGFIEEPGPLHNLLDLLFALSMMMIPVSIAIAILRNNLFDIDVIIRKTLVYALLTGLLGITFIGSIISLQPIFTFLLGTQSPAAIVISTLAIAALFTPLRSRIQTFIDQRFFRQKYDAEKLMAAFARKTRDETDLEALSDDLLEVVHETMHPEQMNLWIRSKQ